MYTFFGLNLGITGNRTHGIIARPKIAGLILK
jgi:hypothetical protein